MSDEIVREFLVESNENLDLLDRELVELEKDPRNGERLASVFRTIHTIKGTCGFLGFTKLEKVTHVGESLLSKLRDRELELGPEIATGLLEMVDAIRQMLASIEANGSEGERDDGKLIGRLAELQKGKRSGPAEDTAKKNSEAGNDQEGSVPTLGEILVDKGLLSASMVSKAIQLQQAGDPRHVGEILVEKGAVKPQDVVEALQMQQAARSAVSEASIRVDVTLLDKLMNLVGELVLARNQIMQFTNSREDADLSASSQRLNLITTELQEGVMKTRMQPIGNIWSKFPRTVRDVATACGKEVRIEMEGKETELDKTIIEAIKDPLTHLVRNAVDHGIETPEKRGACGKPREGRLQLRAYHEGGQVNIEISDDGAGLNFELIRRKAIERGIASAEQAAKMSDREAANLIFAPGFSTAEKVTNVSGRGVGMDVVKTNIEKIGGAVDVQSKAGSGTTVRMKIPLTLAIIPALIVVAGGDRYAIPQVSLLELVRLEGKEARSGIEMVHGAPVYRLRGRLLPLVYLRRELEIGAKSESGGNETGESGAADAGSERIDFELARTKHLLWKSRIRDFLDGKSTLTEQEAGSHKGCALGKWLYGGGLEEYSDLAEMGELETVHEQLHTKVREIIGHKSRGDKTSSENGFLQVGSFSDRIVSLLTTLERRVEGRKAVNIVVLQADERQFGLVVDEVNDTEEIVVKPLGKYLKKIGAYAGATIMGDGKVALILDVLGLAQRTNVVSEVRGRAMAEQEGEQSAGAAEGNQRNAVLLFQCGQNGRMAIHLSLVARLEEFPREAIEIAGDQEVVQYRGQIMPLVRVSQVLQAAGRRAAAEEQDSLQVVVYAEKERTVGLVVDRILDTVDESFVLQPQTGRKGVQGSAVIQKRITDILDVPGLIAAADESQLLARVQA